MRRRAFIKLIGGVAVAWPLAARAQQPAKVLRVGILSPAASEAAATLTAFREGIRDLGYIEGKTIALDFRLSKGNMDALPALAAELVRIPVDVIVTDSTKTTTAFSRFSIRSQPRRFRPPFTLSNFAPTSRHRSRDVLPKINSNGRRVSAHWFAGVLQSLCSPS
jgi:hypothetical protein